MGVYMFINVLKMCTSTDIENYAKRGVKNFRKTIRDIERKEEKK